MHAGRVKFEARAKLYEKRALCSTERRAVNAERAEREQPGRWVSESVDLCFYTVHYFYTYEFPTNRVG